MAIDKPEWSPTFDLGVKDLDDEHRELFKFVGAVRDAIEAREYRKCHSLSEEFLAALGRHFANEEAFLARVGFPGVDKHQDFHASLISEAQALREGCNAPGDGRLLTDCYDRMVKCLMDDVVRGDLEFKSYVEFHGHKNSKSGNLGVLPSTRTRNPRSSGQ
jgi:hemerythrin